MAENNSLNKKDKQAHRQNTLDRKLEMAKRPDSKVMLTRTPESHILYLIMSQADIAISTLKTRLFQEGYSAEEVTSLIQEFYDKARELDRVVAKIHKKCGFKEYKRAKELA
ncbi:MAG: hypothetical protein AB7F25_02845 [Deferribacterales bacterium]